MKLNFRREDFSLMRGKTIIILLLFALSAGCAAPPVDKGFSLSGRTAFEVLPVSNSTGKTFDFDVISALTLLIRTKLKEKEFSITDTREDAIIIRSILTAYETRGTATKCTVEVEFVDKMTKAVLGKIVTSEAISVGGLSSAELNIDQAILESAADDIVFEIEKRIEHKSQLSP